MSLRAILSGSRAKKRPAPTASSSTAKKAKTTSTTFGAQTWPARLPQTKPGSHRAVGKKSTATKRVVDDLFGDSDGPLSGEDGADGADDRVWDDDGYQLNDTGLVASLADDLALRDVVQALRYARDNMFDPVPGLVRSDNDGDDVATTPYIGNSTRVAKLLQLRRRTPPLATTAHVAALLPNATATERETAALIRAGMIRRVVQPLWKRGGYDSGSGHSRDARDTRLRRALAIGSASLGEVLIETAALQQLVKTASLGTDTRAAFLAWLAGVEETGASTETQATKMFTINDQLAPLSEHMVDELVHAGFLVGHGAFASRHGSIDVMGQRSTGAPYGGGYTDTGNVYARPEDRTTLLSLATVARAASGSFAAVGGVGAVYTAGGGGGGSGGGRSSTPQTPTEDLLLSVPGHGEFIELVSGALAHITTLLARTPFRETLVATLRERWNAGGSTEGGATAKRSRTSHPGLTAFRRVSASRTKKWNDFGGLTFDWLLAEAVGAGLVEVFDTGSVGRGVRLLA